jgi:hypothetical protein
MGGRAGVIGGNILFQIKAGSGAQSRHEEVNGQKTEDNKLHTIVDIFMDT